MSKIIIIYDEYINNGFLFFSYQELSDNIRKWSKVSGYSALFSMYDYDKLKKDLNKIDTMHFIYTKLHFSSWVANATRTIS